MTDLRTAAQQALEALEQSETTVPYEGFGMARREAERKHQAAITALRAALAQQAEQQPMHPELRKMWEDHFDKCFRAIPVPEQAEPVEPVAWFYQNMYTEQEYLVWKKGTGGRNWRPLYTAPPQRKPLTDEEIMDAFHAARNAKLGASQDNSKHRLSVVEIARAVERKVRGEEK